MLLKDSFGDSSLRGLDESTRIQIFEFPFCRKSFPSLEKCHTVLLLPQPRFRPNSNYWFPHRPTRSDNYFLALGNWSSQPMPWQNSLFPKEFLLFMIYHPIFSAQAFLVGLKFQDSSLKKASLSQSHIEVVCLTSIFARKALLVRFSNRCWKVKDL